MSDCTTCAERQGYYLDAETIANQQEHIAELENAYNMLQSQFDITRERWMKRGAYIAKQRERIAELESLIRDMWAFYNMPKPDYMPAEVVAYFDVEEGIRGRIEALGLLGGDE